jgi:monoamine oxidase
MYRRAQYNPEQFPLIQRLAQLLEQVAAIPAASVAKRFVIIGAGLAGLCAAFELEQKGHETIVLEADVGHVGGRVRTFRFANNLYGELGAMRIPKNHVITRDYATRFGLTLRKFVQVNENAFYYIRGQKVRIHDEKKLRTQFNLSNREQGLTAGQMWEKAVLSILESLVKPEHDDLNSRVPQTPAVRALDQRTLKQLFELSGLSREAVSYLATLWGVEMQLDTGATEFLREEMKAIWTPEFDEIVGGMDNLPRAFAERLKTRPRVGCYVTGIDQDLVNHKVSAIYDLKGQTYREEADFLLCTVPLPVLARLRIHPPLTAAKQACIRQVSYDSSTKVLLLTAQRFWEHHEGIFGGGTVTDLPTGFTYYPSDNAEAKDKEVSRSPAVMLASYTWGQQARRLGMLSSTAANDEVKRYISNFHPQVQQNGMIKESVKWCWDTFHLSGGAFAWFQPGQHSALYEDLILPEGRIFFAGEHTSLTHSWMQGALESALRAVTEMLQAAENRVTK